MRNRESKSPILETEYRKVDTEYRKQESSIRNLETEHRDRLAECRNRCADGGIRDPFRGTCLKVCV